ncbi:hypothetical protein QO010_000711 [Caulobacter ginsengisoli]|uniref:Pesticin C-terminal domain-containing protein n=1 Tax=Caulobacter ginsengisoli TaxID=400775 RepID=A0ABU0ILR5_9CAUL|nr:hypothetical protein [Caulobacter ginsengisoli]MDQ0462963.1 hypothetical protein [Caulobacter ginsengisoli]
MARQISQPIAPHQPTDTAGASTTPKRPLAETAASSARVARGNGAPRLRMGKAKTVAEKINLKDNAHGNSTESYIGESITDKFARLDLFAAENPGAPVSAIVAELFPELKSVSVERQVPKEPPALWLVDREGKETPIEFIRRHYTPWLGKGLHRGDIRRLDRPLYNALGNYLANHPMPDDIDLPTLQEYNDRWVTRVLKGGEARPENAAEMAKFKAALHQRGLRQNTRS